MHASFDQSTNEQLREIAVNLLQNYPPHSLESRNNIQDCLWAQSNWPEVPKRFRHELAKALEGFPLYLRIEPFEALLDNLFILDDPLESIFSDGLTGLRKEIYQHVFRNNDWSVEYLFDRIGAFACSPRRFGMLLEGLASSDVRPDLDGQTRFVTVVNTTLARCRAELRELENVDGYPVFSLVSVGPPGLGKPKNLIFASQSKPDIRFRDAINNDIEVVSNAEDVLIYERPISSGGLCWRELQEWWASSQHIEMEAAKRALYRRLLRCLPASSPPQKLLFETYFKTFRHAVPELPALLPEVWLHWDPRTVKERGADALLRFRMDFLMLLPNGVRVVIEVDGRQHYADDNGLASPHKYSVLAEADRDLRLLGYEVYHFGANELIGTKGEMVVADFFTKLFEVHKIHVATSPTI